MNLHTVRTLYKKIWALQLVAMLFMTFVFSFPGSVNAIGTAELRTEERSDSVKILESIGDIGKGTTPSLSTYISNGYRFAIGAAGVIAVVQIVFAGIQWIYFGFSEGNVSKAKSRATNAVYGLLAVIFTYFILQLINPAITDNQFDNIVPPLSEKIRKISPVAREGSGSRGADTGQGSASLVRTGSTSEILQKNCPGCVSLTSAGGSFEFDPKVNKNIDASIASKLVTLDQGLDNQRIGWKITEAFPPINGLGRHRHDCHQNGTCVDAALINRAERLDGQKVQAFADEASEAGLFPEYEVQTQGQKEELIASGFTGCVKVLGNHISGAHFSLYNTRQASC
jgi:hypothetical protein